MNRNVLYRVYDTDGVLLYVGATTNLPLRLRTHADNQAPWWDGASDIKLERFDSPELLAAGEIEAIKREQPKYNLMHIAPEHFWAMKPNRRRKGTGSVHRRRADGIWTGTVELPPGPDGKRRTKRVYSKDQAEAERKLAELQHAVARGDVR